MNIPSYLLVPDYAAFDKYSALPQSASSPATVTDNLSPSVETTCQNFPPVERFSGQRAGEDWKSFFACWDAENAKRAEKETEKTRLERQQ